MHTLNLQARNQPSPHRHLRARLFANNQLAVRFIEEIDFDYAATDATAAMITAAS